MRQTKYKQRDTLTVNNNNFSGYCWTFECVCHFPSNCKVKTVGQMLVLSPELNEATVI